MRVQDTILAAPSDTHAGSPVGLIPPGTWQLTSGGTFTPSGEQRLITALWIRGWERVRDARQGKRLIVVHVGDATEGAHHGTTQLITPSVEEHERLHLASMELALKIAQFDEAKGDRLYYVKGTPAHVGQGGASEERIAREFDGYGVVPAIHPREDDHSDGRYLWDRLRLRVNGKLFDIAHHGGNVGTKPWTATNPLRSKLQEVYFRSLETGQKAPDVWLRAHRHVKAYDVFISSTGRKIEGFITPAFQARTEYGYRMGADMLASLGLLWFDVTSSGSITPYWELLEREQDAEEII